MSSKLLEKELNNSEVFKTAIYNEQTKTYFIPKSKIIKIEKYRSYLVELSDILLEDNGDSITQYNWNKGLIPKSKYYRIDVENILGKMIYCVGVGYNPETRENIQGVYWNGFLPKDKIIVLEEI